MTATTGLLDLKKSLELNLTKADILAIPSMSVRLAVDRSGSMSEEFDSGWVDKTINLFIAAAVKFDDNGELEMGFFNTDFVQKRNATESDFKGYLKSVHVSATGGTKFAPVLEEFGVFNKPSGGLFGAVRSMFSSSPVLKQPVYLAMITDGDCYDWGEFEAYVHSLVPNCFLQVIAIGNQVTLGNFSAFSGVKNFSLVHHANPSKLNADAFYEGLCNTKFKTWIDSLATVH